MNKYEIVKKKALQYGATNLYMVKHNHKKYAVLYKGKLIYFGDNRYEDFLDHKDEVRRNRYLKRAKGIRNKEGKLTYKDKFSPNFWSVHLLW